MINLVAGVLFVTVLGVTVRRATRPRPSSLNTADPAPVTLLGVVPPPRTEMIIDMDRLES